MDGVSAQPVGMDADLITFLQAIIPSGQRCDLHVTMLKGGETIVTRRAS